MKSVPTINIVICIHNALNHVKQCLQSVLSDTSIPFFITLVNDGSNKETTEFLDKVCATNENVFVIKNENKVFYTKAANQGIKFLSSDYTVLLNSDTIVPKLWLENIIAIFNRFPDLGLVGPMSNAAGFQSIPKVYDENWVFAVNNLPIGLTLEDFVRRFEFLSLQLVPDVTFLNGFCMVVKRDVFNRIGLFDEGLFPSGYGEEIDFCLRAKEAGFKIKVADNCFVYHSKSQSYGREMRNELATLARTTLYKKFGKDVIDLNYQLLRDNRQLNRIRELNLVHFYTEVNYLE